MAPRRRLDIPMATNDVVFLALGGIVGVLWFDELWGLGYALGMHIGRKLSEWLSAGL